MEKINDWQDKFLNLPEEQRQKIRLTDKGLPKRRYKKKQTYTKEELIKYVQDNFIYSLKKFEQFCEQNEDAPSRYFVRKYFGNWNNLRKQIYGEGLKRFNNPKSIVMACVEYRILSWDKYLEYRKKDERLFPPYKVMAKHFGSWHNLRRLVIGRMNDNIMRRYLLLEHELGKIPTLKDCRDNGIEIEYLYTRISRKDFRELCQYVKELSNEAQKNFYKFYSNVGQWEMEDD